MTDFLDDCRSRGLTDHTIASYKSNIKTFLNFVGDPIQVDTNTLRDFLNYLKFDIEYKAGKQIKKGVCSQTVNTYFSAISTYYDYLIWIKKTINNPTLQFRRRYLSHNKRQYNGENSRQLINPGHARQLLNLDMPIQHKAVLMVLAKTGIRRGELLAIDLVDLNQDKRQIVLKPKAKRTKRLVFYDQETARVLEIFLSWRQPRAKTTALFISTGGVRMDKETPNQIVAEYGSRLGLVSRDPLW